MSTAVPAGIAGANVTDEAKRIKDEMDYHALCGHFGWAVLALADGKPMDHVAYETYRDAVKGAKWNRDNYLFLEIQPDGMPYREAQAVIDYARFCQAMGGRVPAPDDAHLMPPGMPAQPRDRRLMARQLATGRRIPDHLIRNIDPRTLRGAQKG